MSADPLAGTPYRAIAPLGRGAMGEVFDAVHVALDKPVVVKLLHRKLAGRADVVDRMRLEGQALALLSHPSIVAVSDLGFAADDRPYLVMERLRGRTLRAELRARGVLPVSEALAFAAQALAGLGAAHEAGIVHRDLKLENLFVCDAVEAGGSRALKVLDFGLVKVLEGAGERRGPRPLDVPTAENVSMGTPRFFAPEQVEGGVLDARTDVYAMGAVLYELVAGRGPFEHLTSVAEVLRAHAEVVPEAPSRVAPQRVPEALDAAILKALAKAPDERFQSARAFGEALRGMARAEEKRVARGEMARSFRASVAAFAVALVLTVLALVALRVGR